MFSLGEYLTLIVCRHYTNDKSNKQSAQKKELIVPVRADSLTEDLQIASTAKLTLEVKDFQSADEWSFLSLLSIQK